MFRLVIYRRQRARFPRPVAPSAGASHTHTASYNYSHSHHTRASQISARLSTRPKPAHAAGQHCRLAACEAAKLPGAPSRGSARRFLHVMPKIKKRRSAAQEAVMFRNLHLASAESTRASTEESGAGGREVDGTGAVGHNGHQMDFGNLCKVDLTLCRAESDRIRASRAVVSLVMSTRTP